jgi:hypothetical protein
LDDFQERKSAPATAAILIKRIEHGNGDLRRDDWKLPPLLIKSGAIKGKIMSSPASQTSSRHDVALFLLRIASAAAFLYHGSAILFGAFGGPGSQNFAAYLHVPVIVGYLVGSPRLPAGWLSSPVFCSGLVLPASLS